MSGRKLGHTIWISLGGSPFNEDVLTLRISNFEQGLAECLGALR